MDVIIVYNGKIEIFQDESKVEQVDPGTYQIGRESGVPADKMIILES